MDRTDVIQAIVNKKRACAYLEIGVARGINFFPIRARNKVAVDPRFRFGKRHRIRQSLENPWNLLARYYELTSDAFFSGIGKSRRFDVVFIDGLHTYRQSLRDVTNALDHLKKHGVIVMHDCNPPTREAAIPADSYEHAVQMNAPGWTGPWCGDVWKTVCHIRSTRRDLRVFVVDRDFGLAIIVKGKPDTSLDLSAKQIQQMAFTDFSRSRRELLDLRNDGTLHEFLQSL